MSYATLRCVLYRGAIARTSRKRDERVERSKKAILDVTRELLAEEGDVGALTVEAVATRSGVAKTTIYRRWRDKWELALDAVMIDMLPGFAEPVDVGDTREELITFVDAARKNLSALPSGLRCKASPRRSQQTRSSAASIARGLGGRVVSS